MELLTTTLNEHGLPGHLGPALADYLDTLDRPTAVARRRAWTRLVEAHAAHQAVLGGLTTADLPAAGGGAGGPPPPPGGGAGPPPPPRPPRGGGGGGGGRAPRGPGPPPAPPRPRPARGPGPPPPPPPASGGGGGAAGPAVTRWPRC